MEHGERPRSQAEVRKDQFDARAKAAKRLAEMALEEIDDALIECQLRLTGSLPIPLDITRDT